MRRMIIDKTVFYYRCPKCKCVIRNPEIVFPDFYSTNFNINFCPNCGADVRGEDDESN